MKAVILAAGMGSRLDDSPDHLPKALTPLVDQSSILACQLRELVRYLPLDDIWIVVGYRKEAIMEAFPDLGFIYNSGFQQENTSKSLLRALRKLDEDILWMNGDVVFRPEIVDRLIKENRTAMVVNQAAVGQEEVKYRADPQGLILEVSKQVREPQGEALGINLFKKEDVPLLRDKLEECSPTDFFEKGIEQCIQSGLKVWTVPVGINDCAEVDFPDDLVRARQLIHQWGS